MNNKNDYVLQCQALYKSFFQAKDEIQVLQGINLSVLPGESIAIVGASGSGKSTLLHLLGSLDEPTAGKIIIQGNSLDEMSIGAKNKLRNNALGFVYQFHHLLPEFTALENVAMPLLVGRSSTDQAEKKAKETLEKVGLGHRVQHKPSELSGGERQRAAIARALVTNPACVLADEPTGNLDEATASQVWQLMLQLKNELKISFIVVTHDMHLAQHMDRIFLLTNGKLTENNVA